MKCLRCGYCCQTSWVVVVRDPGKGLKEDNLTVLGERGPERCPHLRGDKPGEFSCAVHDRKWYRKTPCFSRANRAES